MRKTKICIIGLGTYGSYLTKRLLEHCGTSVDITILETGDKHTQSEQEIGFKSSSQYSNAASQGRFFGLGGTSAKWGGQILFFDERENPSKDSIWETIITLNQKYKRQVLKQLLGDRQLKKLDQYTYEQGAFKTGLWLKYTKRNLFQRLSATQLAQVELKKKVRVVAFKQDGEKILGVITINQEGLEEYIAADVFYLTAGAIESCRLLLQSMPELTQQTDLGKNFGDHISIELLRIYGQQPKIVGMSIVPRIINGSLATRRLIVQTQTGRIGFLHPIYNKDVQVFTLLKSILFGKQKSKVSIKDLLHGMLFLFLFGSKYLFFNKLHIHKNNWSLQLDLEQSFPNTNQLSLSGELDIYNQRGVSLNWNISDEDRACVAEIKDQVINMLKQQGTNYHDIASENDLGHKIEDVYHPVGFIRMGTDERAVANMNYQIEGTNNLFHFSTALLPSAKAINPTAAAFCFIEDHLDRSYSFLNKAI
ncbi:GMC oxidoreductase [Haliscomenobacter hydrossis]|uniref:Glucose-methanol-choline oxidoreductase C-terminal domain-containing protein n=1 Tax=Haliscomenobacter hydrossis (strain ATCC 27775 / DSM 1100 / LMG 10767 / O) TaxID=760192 RepID=F4L453_HALH1|nr:GMC oxidoreductase [Haliscomenobacter hydrossis]AEE50751.1 hypothetical protein Halhy_2886 [Haliscomenobacter hydrossis DSM 1100]